MPYQTRALRIFVVENSAIVCQRLQEMISSIEGVRAIGQADRASDAIRNILIERPDVVILDLKLADGSGFDVLRALHKQAPAIDVYMITNFASEPYRRIAERLGARGFFDKTTEFSRVRDTIATRAMQLH